MPADSISIRTLSSTDSLSELTSLIHRTYKRLADVGFNYTATNQTVETTREGIENGERLIWNDDRPAPHV